MNESPIQWECEQCGARNIDSYLFTAVPMCGNCGCDTDWDDILVQGTRLTCRGCYGTGVDLDGREMCMDCGGAGYVFW